MTWTSTTCLPTRATSTAHGNSRLSAEASTAVSAAVISQLDAERPNHRWGKVGKRKRESKRKEKVEWSGFCSLCGKKGQLRQKTNITSLMELARSTVSTSRRWTTNEENKLARSTHARVHFASNPEQQHDVSESGLSNSKRAASRST